ncbi:MAG: endonuclease III [Burkholderiales bacterium]|nr:endonuclease III [Burkholderiales bacterium]
MNPENIQRFFDRLSANDPQPTTELKFRSVYELLVAVVLSAQATDKSVNKATARLFKIANTPSKMIALSEEKLIDYIQSIGLFRTKARNIIALSKILLSDYGGNVPNTREALEKLPGVGRKTANVILNTAFGQPTIAVDTHIFRVANRTGLATGKNVREVEDKLMQVVPKKFQQYAHHWLILHGRYICTARTPRCLECIVNDLCDYP